MNLAIDIGNTLVKVGVFQDHRLVFNDRFQSVSALQNLEKIRLDFPDLSHAIYSASGHTDEKLLEYIRSNFETYQLTHTTPVNFTNRYETPQTLGLDRIALVSAAQYLYPDKNVLIIDAGTCLTIDFKSDKGTYTGGNISPGILMRLKALNHFTAKLPLVQFEEPTSFPLGKNTKDAILNGVINGVVYEIDEYISRYKSDCTDLTVILTGGNQQYLSTKLKSGIFADSTFQLFGLHAILEKILND